MRRVFVGGRVRVSHTVCITPRCPLTSVLEVAAGRGGAVAAPRLAHPLDAKRVRDVADRAALPRLDRAVVALARPPRVSQRRPRRRRRAGRPERAAPACRLCRATRPTTLRRPSGPACRSTPAIGMTIAMIASTRAVAWIMSPSAQAVASTSCCLPRLAHAVPIRRGSARIAIASVRRSSGTTTITHTVTTMRAHGLSMLRLRVAPPPRQHAEQRRLDAGVEVGNAGEVGEHVVAVEPHQRRELPEHLQDLRGDDQQQGVVPQPQPHAGDGDRDDRVEVQPAEVGAHPAAAAEAVGVGDVGVERRPDEVDAEAHHAGRRAAVSRRRGVPELVEARRQHGDREDQDQQAGPFERVVRRRGQPLAEEHPPAHDRERGQHGRRPSRAGTGTGTGR